MHAAEKRTAHYMTLKRRNTTQNPHFRRKQLPRRPYTNSTVFGNSKLKRKRSGRETYLAMEADDRDNQRLSASRLAQPIRQLQLNPNTQTQAQTIQISQPKVLILVTFDPGLSNARRRKTKKRTTGRRKVNKLQVPQQRLLLFSPFFYRGAPRATPGAQPVHQVPYAAVATPKAYSIDVRTGVCRSIYLM
jgi:hypothetical protein